MPLRLVANCFICFPFYPLKRPAPERVNGSFASQAQNLPSRQIPAVVELSLFVHATIRPPLSKARFQEERRKLNEEYRMKNAEYDRERKRDRF
jgi:hypothetical protein